MKKIYLTDFEAFRTWFNKTFKLSLNHHFVGVGRLKNWKLFAYRLYKILNGYYRKPFGDKIVINLHGENCVLYSF